LAPKKIDIFFCFKISWEATLTVRNSAMKEGIAISRNGNISKVKNKISEKNRKYCLSSLATVDNNF